MRQDGTACKTWVPSDGLSLADCTMRAGWGEGGFSFSLPDTSELVILSAAGAKDLLFPQMRRTFRCEGPLDAKDLLFRAPQGADDLRCGVEEQQVLRSRASRALAQ